jgi:hypothetical protein
MMRIVAAAIGLIFVSGAQAQDLAQPHFTPQDSWVYHQKVQRGDKIDESDVELSVVRSDNEDLLIGVKAAGSPKAPVESMFKPDWARFRGVNGVETVTTRPLSFPLALNKTWTVSYVENNPNPQVAREAIDVVYKVAGWEDVTTPAGAFKTLRIEGKGNWVADTQQRVQTNALVAKQGTAVAQSSQNVVQAAQKTTGRIYRVVWYAPEVKRWVRSRDETFTSAGLASVREETELTAFHLAPAAP